MNASTATAQPDRSPLSALALPFLAGALALAGCERTNPVAITPPEPNGSQSWVHATYDLTSGPGGFKINNLVLSFPVGQYRVSVVEFGMSGGDGQDYLKSATQIWCKDFSIAEPGAKNQIDCPAFEAGHGIIMISGRNTFEVNFHQIITPSAVENPSLIPQPR